MTDTSDLWQWISAKSPRRLSPAALRLFCFPYAAAGSSIFRNWPDALPPVIDFIPVQLPGRESRWAEARFEDLPSLARALCAVLRPLLVEPYALFGHSMGALIVFELARELRRQELPLPTQLFVSSARAPHLPERESRLHRLSDRSLWTRVIREYGDGVDAAMLNPELASVLLPILRSDLRLCENYRPEAEEPFSFPITVYGGRRDRRITKADLQSWNVHTLGRFRVNFFPGGHFFLHSDRALFLETLSRDLTALAGDMAPTSCTPR
jgi:medium-chain acyl-[acyl-carrier-protein] hydrolase